MVSDDVLYTSKSTVKSLWQVYRIFADRIELETHLGTLAVPLSEVEKVEVRKSDLKGLMHGELQLKDFRPALKLDWANFVEHVVLDKSGGKIHRILFTPENPSEFKEKLEEVLAGQH